MALLSGAIVATNFGYYSIGRMALPDLPLTFFITLAIWAGWVAMLENDRHRTRWVLLSAAALGLGFLTKGPVGVIIPGLVVVPVVLHGAPAAEPRAARTSSWAASSSP